MVTLPNLGLFDIGLSSLYLIIIYFFASRFQQKKIEKNPEYKYFLFGFSTKIIGAVSFVLISMYYYEKGDTFLYFQIAEDLRTNLFIDFKGTIETLLTSYGNLHDCAFNPLEKYNYYYERTSNWDFGRLVFVFNLLSFGSYLVSSILMAIVSFFGLWLGYITVCRLYQSASKLLIIPFFLIPTALIWSSGILKDTVVIGTVGLLLFTFSKIFIYKESIVLNILVTVVGIFILQLLRPILLFVLIPSLFFWGLLYLTGSLKVIFLKLTIRVGLVLGIVAFGLLINQYATSENSKYKIDNLMKTLQGFQSYHSMEKFSKGQNVYTLKGIMESPKEVVNAIPSALNVTFFRPYLWEVNNLAMFLGAIESVLLLVFVFYVIYYSRENIFKILFTNKEFIFMLGFSISYGFIVGVSSYNFGALSRYKVPAIMFFGVSLIIIYNEAFKFHKK